MLQEPAVEVAKPGLTFLVWLTKVLMSFAVSLWIGADTDIKILFVLSIADFTLSFFNPKVHIWEVVKRLTVGFLLVGTVHLVYAIAHNEAHINVGSDISSLVGIFFCLTTAVKILKSCSVFVNLPPALLDFIIKVDGLSSADREELEKLKAKQEDVSTKD